MSRDRWADHAKGIGILLVVYGHVARGLVAAGLPVDHALFALVDSILYTFHMPLFFFLSGVYFLESLRRAGPLKLFANKIDLLLYPYVVWSLLHGGIEVALAGHTNGKVQLAEVLAFPWAPRTHFWFLYALFLVFAIVLVLYGAMGLRRHAALLGAAVILYLALPLFPHCLQLIYVAQNLVFLCAGICFSTLLPDVERYHAGGFLVLACLFAALQWILHVDFAANFETGPRWLLLTLGMVGTLMVVTGSMLLAHFRLRALAAIGVASFGIYLMHTLAGAAMRIALQQVGGVASVGWHMALGVTAGVLGPMLALHCIRWGRLDFLLAPGRLRAGAILQSLARRRGPG